MLLAKRTLAFRRVAWQQVPPLQGVENVLSLAKEHDRRQDAKAVIRCVLRRPVDRTWVPIRGHPPTPFGRDLA